jgi:hypothetical protein
MTVPPRNYYCRDLLDSGFGAVTFTHVINPGDFYHVTCGGAFEFK